MTSPLPTPGPLPHPDLDLVPVQGTDRLQWRQPVEATVDQVGRYWIFFSLCLSMRTSPSRSTTARRPGLCWPMQTGFYDSNWYNDRLLV